jgi:hypothetical protein
MNQDSVIGVIVALATGMVVVMGIGYFIRLMMPRRIPARISQATDIRNKTVKELFESDMTIDELIHSVRRAEEEMGR